MSGFFMDQSEIRTEMAKTREKRVRAEATVAEAIAELQELRNFCKHPGVPMSSDSKTVKPQACPDCQEQIFLSVAGRA